MLQKLLVLACLLNSPTFDAPVCAPPVGEEKALRALDAWLKLYRGGKIDFRSKENIAKDSLALKYGLTPKGGLGNPTWAGDLEVILADVVKLDTAEAADALIEVAAIGLDQGKYTVEMAPYEVRATAEKHAHRLGSADAKQALARAARGEVKTDKNMAAAVQAAGVRCLGLTKDLAYRETIEQQLGDGDEIVRIQAAELLALLGDEAAALPLIATIDRDTSDAVLITAAQSLRSLYAKYLPKSAASPVAVETEPKDPAPVPTPGEAGTKETPATGKGEPPAPVPAPATAPEVPESVRLAVRAAIRAIGRTTWRADMAMVRLLDDFRSHEAVPALIAVLERFRTNLDDLKSGKLSGLLLYQAHELLVSMTGAVFPADQPEKWREMWDRDKDKIVVTQKRPPSSAGPTASGGFCGVPVQGTRVVFVLDLSGSMEFPMDEQDGEGKKRRSIRLDFAKRELARAADALAPNAMFTLITFNGDDKADAWTKDLVAATPATRERFKKHVNQLRARGGTNLWAGLESALKIKSLVYGNRYQSNIDELFVLSDGAPSVGEVTDSVEILRLVEEGNRFAKVRINTIFISSATPPEHRQADDRLTLPPKELMRRMAADNGGQFRDL